MLLPLKKKNKQNKNKNKKQQQKNPVVSLPKRWPETAAIPTEEEAGEEWGGGGMGVMRRKV